MSDPQRGSVTAITSVSPVFKFVLLLIFLLTALLITLSAVLAVAGQNDTAQDFQKAWQASITAMLALIGGKALA
jgi:hypothetical protein